MSKQVVSQRMKQTCDGCGSSKEWELVGADADPNILAEMQCWFVVARKIVNDRGEIVALSADACSVACVSTIAEKLMKLPESEPADKIDLASLRIN